MFWYDFDVMESLEFLWELNTAQWSGRFSRPEPLRKSVGHQTGEKLRTKQRKHNNYNKVGMILVASSYLSWHTSYYPSLRKKEEGCHMIHFLSETTPSL